MGTQQPNPFWEHFPDISSYTTQNPSLPLNQRYGFDTALTPEQEAEFQDWAKMIMTKNPYFTDAMSKSPRDYDYRAVWMAMKNGKHVGGLNPYDNMFHLDDTGKKPNHESFSTESVYAKDHPENAGSWLIDNESVKPFQAIGNYQPTYLPPTSGIISPKPERNQLSDLFKGFQ